MLPLAAWRATPLLALCPDGKYLAVLGQGPVRVWEVPSWKQVVSLRGEGYRLPNRVAFSPESRLLAISGGYVNLVWFRGGLVEFWEVEGWKRRGSLWRHQDGIAWGLAFSPDGTHIATGGSIYNGEVGLSRVP